MALPPETHRYSSLCRASVPGPTRKARQACRARLHQWRNWEARPESRCCSSGGIPVSQNARTFLGLSQNMAQYPWIHWLIIIIIIPIWIAIGNFWGIPHFQTNKLGNNWVNVSTWLSWQRSQLDEQQTWESLRLHLGRHAYPSIKKRATVASERAMLGAEADKII